MNTLQHHPSVTHTKLMYMAASHTQRWSGPSEQVVHGFLKVVVVARQGLLCLSHREPHLHQSVDVVRAGCALLTIAATTDR